MKSPLIDKFFEKRIYRYYITIKISGIQFSKYFISKHNLSLFYYIVNCNKIEFIRQ
jgi:hypothetical protein